MRNVEKRSGCPISHTLDVFGDQWTLLVIRDLMFKGKRHYREMLRSEEGIASNILASRLRQLVAGGVISKTRDEEDRKRFIYKLTEKGRDLAPVLLEMIVWSGKHDPTTVVSEEYMARAVSRRSQLVKGMQRAALE